jgi:hypothetical protein
VDADRLKAAISKLAGTTAAAKLRQVMPEIDRKVHDGVRHGEIIAALNAEGLDATLETFRKNLYRYRAKLRKAEGSFRPVKPTAQVTGNSPVGTIATDETPTADNANFEAALDPKKRDQIGEQYLARRLPLIGKKRSG